MHNIDIKHYVKKLKEHESQRLSTNQRNAYWKSYEISKRDPFVTFDNITIKRKK